MKSIKQFIKKKLGITSLQKQIENLTKTVSSLQEENLKKDKMIKKLEQKNTSLKEKVKLTDEWLRRTREDMWELNRKTNERIKDSIGDISTQVNNCTHQIENNVHQIENNVHQIENNVHQITQLKERCTNSDDWIKNTREHLWQIRSQSKDIEYKLYKYMPKEKYEEALADWYYYRTAEKLDLNNPKTFNEKIQWLKLYDTTEEKTLLSDKYLVREFIKERVGEQYLIPLLGVWEQFDDIDFDVLPNRFVLKANHGSAMNIIVKDKDSLDISASRKTINQWMRTNYAYNGGFELQYAAITPKIIAEEYIENVDDLRDYKFLCFNGVVQYIWVDSNRYVDHRRDFFDLEWNHMDAKFIYDNADVQPSRPDNLDEMIEVAKMLCQGFVHVRVDLYNVNGKIYFGEMTFTSDNGVGKFEQEDFAMRLGDLIKLPNNK